MPHYPKYTTTVIGAYSVPRWYEPLDRLVTIGQLLPEDMGDAQYRVMQAAIVDQEIAGIDGSPGGETTRGTQQCHQTAPHRAHLSHRQIADDVVGGLYDKLKEFWFYPRKPVKITMTGPHFL